MSDRKVQEAIQILSGNHLSDKVYSIQAKVLSVDEDKRTCRVQVISGKANNEFIARLMPVVDDGVLIIPEADSIVNIVMSDFTDPYISQYSGVSKIIFRGGDLGGLVKVIDLTKKLNNLENKLNDLITKYNTHVHPGVQSGGSSTAVTTSIEMGQLTPTSRQDIENDKITHG